VENLSEVKHRPQSRVALPPFEFGVPTHAETLCGNLLLGLARQPTSLPQILAEVLEKFSKIHPPCWAPQPTIKEPTIVGPIMVYCFAVRVVLTAEKSMSRSSPIVLLAFIIAFAIAGCADKAKPDHATCIQANAKGDVERAWRACNDAISADPTSESGKAAAKLLEEMKPSYENAKAQRVSLEAKAAETRRKADADARSQAVALAKQRVEAKFWSLDRDGECTGHGWPPFRKSYEGGTFEEDDLVALAAGCVHLFPGTREPQLFTIFCCPR